MAIATTRSIPVSRPTFGIAEERAVIQVLQSRWVTQGPRVAEFESAFATYVGAPHAVAVSSCTTALHLALVTAGIGPGDEVLCPSLSFIATANAIVHAGATPVFVDVDESTYNMDPRCIEAAATEKTRAILVVHQIGLPAALEDIKAIANRRGWLLIEDAACAIGSLYKGERIGRPHTLAACFSFHPRKILTTGDGGMITTRDADLADRFRRLRQHAMTVSDVARHRAKQVMTESYLEVGFNYRMTDLQAAIGLVQLERVDDFLARRRALAQRYNARLSELSWLQVPQCPEECVSNFQSYMIRLRPGAPLERDSLMQELLNLGIATRRGVMAIHRETPYWKPELDALLPVTNKVAESTLILPLYHEMSEEDQDYVIESVARFGT